MAHWKRAEMLFQNPVLKRSCRCPEVGFCWKKTDERCSFCSFNDRWTQTCPKCKGMLGTSCWSWELSAVCAPQSCGLLVCGCICTHVHVVSRNLIEIKSTLNVFLIGQDNKIFKSGWTSQRWSAVQALVMKGVWDFRTHRSLSPFTLPSPDPNRWRWPQTLTVQKPRYETSIECLLFFPSLFNKLGHFPNFPKVTSILLILQCGNDWGDGAQLSAEQIPWCKAGRSPSELWLLLWWARLLVTLCLPACFLYQLLYWVTTFSSSWQWAQTHGDIRLLCEVARKIMWAPNELYSPVWARPLQIKIQWIYPGTGHFEYPAVGEAFQSLHLTRHQRTQAGCVRSREIQLAQTAWGMADFKCLWVSLLQIWLLFFSLAVQAEVTGFLFIYKGKKCMFYFKQSVTISQELELKNSMKLCVTLKLSRAGDTTACSGSMGLVYVCESSESRLQDLDTSLSSVW